MAQPCQCPNCGAWKPNNTASDWSAGFFLLVFVAGLCSVGIGWVVIPAIRWYKQHDFRTCRICQYQWRLGS